MEGASILIVEDEAISALYLKNLLSRMQYAVADIVATGEKAITRAEELKPELVLMDIRLAGEMDGIQAADVIHSQYDIPVVFLTAHLDEDSMRRAMSTEPAGYVSKPASERELRGTIEMALKNDGLQKQLKASEIRYRSIFNSASVSIFEVDFSPVKCKLDELRQDGITDIPAFLLENPNYLRQLLNDLIISEVNDWSLLLFNAPDRQTLMSSFTKLILSETIPLFIDVLTAIWEGKPYFEGEGKIQTITGEIKYINIHAAFLTGGVDLSRVLLIGDDITQRKLAEDAIRESEEKYRRIVDTAYEGMWALDENNVTTFVNTRIIELLGYQPDEMIGHRVEDFLFPEDHYHHLKRMEARHLGMSERYERRFRCKDGKTVWAIISASPMVDTQGKFVGSFAMLTDITERRQAEKELLESERRYRLLIESSPTIITVVQNGFFVFINRKTEQITGYSREELISKPIVEFIHVDDREKFIEINHKIIKSEPVDMPFNVRIVSKSGEIIWLEVNSSMITWIGTPASLNFFTNITERKHTEEQLRLQAMVLDQIQDRVTVTDLNGRITYVNDAESRLFKYSRQELVGKSVEIYGEDASRGATQKEILEKTLSTGEWRGEVVNFDLHGNEVILDSRTHVVYDVQGNPIAICGIATDISENKKIEKALAESEARYRQIVENTQEGIWILDKNFKVAFVNHQFCEMFGYTQEEILGMRIDDLVFEEDLEEHYKRRKDRQKGKAEQYEQRFRRKDGTPLWAHVTATPIVDDQGQFQGPIAFVTDITARKEVEQVLERERIRSRTMAALSLDLSTLNLDFQTTIQTSVARIKELSGDLCIIRLITDDGQFLTPVALYHPESKGRKAFEKKMSTFPMRIDEGIFAQAVKKGVSIVVSKESTPDLIKTIKKEYQVNLMKLDIVCGMLIPLRTQGRVIGDIILGRSSKQTPYNEDDQRFYQEIADRIALAISNARLYTNAQKEIDERRKIESVLRHSEEKYRDLFELSPDSTLLVDTNGIILDCNLSTGKLTGIPKEELVGKAFFQVAHLAPEDLKKYKNYFKHGKVDQLFPLDTEIVLNDGQKLDIEIFPKLIKKEDIVLGLQVIVRDITQRKNSEQKLKDSLAEKETLLSELHHRVKNNLASIISMMDLKKNYASDAQTVEMMTDLQERVRLMGLIHEQLYHSKNIHQVNFAKYVEDLTTNLTRALLKERDILLDIHTDAVQLGVSIAIPCGQIITELVTNSLKYAFPDDDLVKWKDNPRRIEIDFRLSDNHYILKVSDNGVGLQTGFNIENAETLGLQLVGLLTHQLNGTIEIVSTSGTTVLVRFPCSPVGK